MGDYHDLYLKPHFAISWVFEKVISRCLKYYWLDPCHYFSSPGLTWDAMLKITGIELELIPDIDIYLFIEKEMRGGISDIHNRYSKANNKFMESYDNKKPSTYNIYLDENDLYGWVMSQYLPYGGFKKKWWSWCKCHWWK